MLTTLAKLPIGANLPTPELLRRLRTALLVTVVVALGGALATVTGTQQAATAVDQEVVPAAMAISAVWNELRVDDMRRRDCVVALPAGGTVDCAAVLVSGSYRRTVANAVQQLAVLAERDIGDSADRQAIQIVQGLLISYLGLVEQAHLYFSQHRSLLGSAYLGYASDLLDNAILKELNAVRQDVVSELDLQRTVHWRTPQFALLWLLPLLVGLVLLVASQIYLTARFNRWVNWPLVTAVLGLVAFGIGASRPLWGGGGFASSTRSVRELVAVPLGEGGTAKIPDRQLVAAVQDAAAPVHLEYLMPVIASVVLVLIVVGFQRRLDEYRLRAR